MAEVGKGVNAGKLASNVQKRLTRAQEKGVRGGLGGGCDEFGISFQTLPGYIHTFLEKSTADTAFIKPSREKARVMQKLGKADETKDTAFEEQVANFNKQLMCVSAAMHECSKRLHDCLAEMYDPEWFGKEEVDSIAEEMIEKEMDNNLEDTDLLWQDFHEKLTDNALLSMDTYLGQFPDIKGRIAKRERKLVDFDSARHHFASVQKGKKKDEAKIAKAEEDLGRAQKVFEEINYDLQEELPTLWNSRVGFYVNTFRSVAGLEEKFHRDMGKINQNLSDIMTKLEEQRLANEEAANHEQGSLDAPKSPSKFREGSPVSRPARPASYQEERQENIINLYEDDTNTSPQPQEAPWSSWEPSQSPSQQWDSDNDTSAPAYGQEYVASQWDEEVTPAQLPYDAPNWDEPESQPSAGSHWEDGEGSQVGQEQDAGTNWDNDADRAWEAESDVPQWDELHNVKAMHDYSATDSDELDLKAGDVVLVLPFANPDEQDDGWLMGVKESHWLQNKNLLVKGVFPENFTQKL
ncbi:hypothetical protein DNTS_016525 [Danionella cerebrum]|uniref:Myc box-dependent-interacting protein 1 n=1 Tax=Danionella cerebrum TaxID=2873325 RepID=A0A553MR86_9TELE|nr:hypothetical protein DNTS_016525 [Danionella translucida]